MKTKTHIVTVEGRYPFPVDMLRYDGLTPREEQDSGKITSSLDWASRTPGETFTIQLRRVAEPRWTPTAARWSSFGWYVTEHYSL